MNFEDFIRVLATKFKQASNQGDMQECLRLVNLLIATCEDTRKNIQNVITEQRRNSI